MKHAVYTKNKLNRTSSHRRCLFANMLKALIFNGRIETTLPKAKALKREADKIVTLAKENTLSARRRAISQLMVRYNTLTPKEARAYRENQDKSAWNDDRQVIDILFGQIAPRFTSRNGGYTRIIRNSHRAGDNSETCFIEYLEA